MPHHAGWFSNLLSHSSLCGCKLAGVSDPNCQKSWMRTWPESRVGAASDRVFRSVDQSSADPTPERAPRCFPLRDDPTFSRLYLRVDPDPWGSWKGEEVLQCVVSCVSAVRSWRSEPAAVLSTDWNCMRWKMRARICREDYRLKLAFTLFCSTRMQIVQNHGHGWIRKGKFGVAKFHNTLSCCTKKWGG